MMRCRRTWIGIVLLALGCHAAQMPVTKPIARRLTLAESRQGRHTRLLRHEPAPEPFDNQAPPGAEQVTYRSAGRDLIAWLWLPQGTRPHPGIMHAHGGFAVIAKDFDDVRPLVEAGFAVLIPAWRGENGNRGSFEMCYGEVDDASAALDFLRNRAEVDARRVYATGHNVGGTIALLLAETRSDLRGVAVSGAFLDLRGVVEETRRMPLRRARFPFDWRDPLETDLRSPARHVADLHCPARLFYADHPDEEYAIVQARKMVQAARAAGKEVTLHTVPGVDHAGTFRAVTPNIITFFRSLE